MRQQSFSFDMILDQTASSADVFDEVKNLVVNAVEGFNSNIML
jgi:hypothetical protein